MAQQVCGHVRGCSLRFGMGPIEALRVEARVHYFHEHVTLHNNCVDTIEVAV